ncbi:hypothetical protein [Dyella caseinilytica]|uniref:Uncharacterized protein n=1 Tax=Dyella caseinilytica TaxID=1849581 RepID=A0ABX7GWC4_9GAMM|nr:hypothetical protein [Dyella caseinilytica]QRN54761.1 hypothetical protein ISN74_05240 [Dyella caseinilytica]GFZ96654.1 hypothetical protein GCM10011408_16340 [Dyella caseinilytica]
MERMKLFHMCKVFWLLAWLFVILAATWAPQVARASNTSIGQMDPVCQSWPMPTGYVITSVQLSQPCNSAGTGYAYAVDLPSDGMTVCNNRAEPAPYVVTSLATSTKCAPLFDEGIIHSVTDGMSICGDALSPIPDAYIVTSASNTDKVTCNGASIYRVQSASAGAAMCSISARPSGYVVDHVNSSNQCIGFNSYTLKPVTEGVSACSFSRLPDGYVVTAGAQTPNCTDGDLHGDYWTFNQPYDGVVVCPFSPVPSGYYLTGTVNSNKCYGASFGYVLKQL